MLDGTGTWEPADSPLLFMDPSQWSSTRVVGYTMQPTGVVNLSLAGTGFYGPTLASASYTYMQVSPYIASLTMTSPGFNTTGGSLIVLQGA